MYSSCNFHLLVYSLSYSTLEKSSKFEKKKGSTSTSVLSNMSRFNWRFKNPLSTPTPDSAEWQWKLPELLWQRRTASPDSAPGYRKCLEFLWQRGMNQCTIYCITLFLLILIIWIIHKFYITMTTMGKAKTSHAHALIHIVDLFWFIWPPRMYR